ncbi:MAG: response regulator [bacterium]|nr:response regulator [bacterium]MBU1918414.1 response regulator [bacterium]
MTDNEKNEMRQLLHDVRSHLSLIGSYFAYAKREELPEEHLELMYNTEKGYMKLCSLVDVLARKAQPQQTHVAWGNVMAQPKSLDSPENGCILVIDDDEHMRTLFKNEIERRGKKVIVLEKGEDLLNQFIDLKNVTAAIVDYEFENSTLDGFDIVEYLRTQQIKHIHLCTGCYDDPYVITRAQKLGIVSIISKPVPEHLWEVL